MAFKIIIKKYWAKTVNGLALLILSGMFIFDSLDAESFFKSVGALWVINQIIKNS
jgi:hypothetical protein